MCEDETAEKLGSALIAVHDYVLDTGHSQECFTHLVNTVGEIVSRWTMHPKRRNWSLIRDLEHITSGSWKKEHSYV